MAFNRFVDLSQEHPDNEISSIWSNTGLVGSTNLKSLSAEASEMARFVRYRLGEPVLTVELDNSQIDAFFESSSLEYSRVYHTMQISNNFATIFGLSQDYSSHDLKMKLPQETFSFLRRYTQNFGSFGPTPVGGNIDTKKGYLTTVVGQQEYDIYDDLYDDATNQPLRALVNAPSVSGNNPSVKITKLHHYPPLSLYRYFDPWSNLTVMSQEFNFESYAMGGQYYILPVWNDILRAQVFKEGDLVRRSNFSYNQISNRIQLMPTPKRSFKIFCEYFIEPDAMNPPSALTATNQFNQINALWNVPITDIHFDEMNPTARQWVREFTVALCKEALGLIRDKYKEIPIPNGTVALNGADLISQGREDQLRLREELKETLEQFKKENLMEKEAKMMEMTYNQLKYFPLGGPIMG